MQRIKVWTMCAAAIFVAAAPATEAIAASTAGPAKRTLPSAKGTFAGKVEGTGAYIALVSDGRRGGGYICDNSSASKWTVLSIVTSGRATLRARTGETLGSVSIVGKSA